MKTTFVTIILSLCCLTGIVRAQVPTCSGDVPFYQVDLTEDPNGFWVSPNHVRQGQCCENAITNCTSFEITLAPDAVAINFEIASGAIPPGAMFYQVNCGPQVPVGEPICLNGGGPHQITFCKPGNNANTYKVTSLSYPVFPEDDILRLSCNKKYEVKGFAKGSITWNSVSPGAPGEYNDYLTCTDCPATQFIPDKNAPDEIEYEICGTPTASVCGYTIPTCKTVKFTVLKNLVASANPNPAAFCNTGEGSGVLLTGKATGGLEPYQFTWINSTEQSDGNTVFANTVDTYKLEVRDALSSKECPVASVSVNVTENSVPIVDAGPDQDICSKEPEIQLSGIITNATGGTWSGGMGVFTPSAQNLNAVYTPTDQEIIDGTLTLTLTSNNNNDCLPVEDQVTVTFHDEVVTNTTFTKCFDSENDLSTVEIDISGGNGGPYEVSTDNGATFDLLNNNTTSLLQGNTYQIIAKDNSGCISKPEPVEIPSHLTTEGQISSFIGGANVSCTGATDGAIDVTVLGGTPPYNYLWNNGKETEDITQLPEGEYQIQVTDVNGCTAKDTYSLNAPPPLTIVLSSPLNDNGYNISCFGNNDGKINSNVKGGTLLLYNYNWTGPNGFTSTEGSPTDLMAGEYILEVSDANNCIAEQTITLTEPDEILYNLTKSTYSGGFNISCFGKADGIVTVIPEGVNAENYEYSWTGPENFSSETAQITDLSPGTYNLTITDNNGCTKTESTNLIEPEILAVNTFTTEYSGGFNISCADKSDGLVTVQASGGDSLSYQYLWEGPEGYTSTDTNLENVPGGNYFLTITDNNGCITHDTIELTAPLPLQADLEVMAYNETSLACYGAADGAISATGSGGDTTSYVYTWKGPEGFTATGTEVSGLKAGVYNFTLKDNNCLFKKNITISEPDSLYTIPQVLSNYQGYPVSCAGAMDGSAKLHIYGGTPPYSYLWSNGDTTNMLTNAPAGNYEAVITDQHNCRDTIGIKLTAPDSIKVDYALEHVPCNGFVTGSINLTVTGGAIGFVYSWSNGATSQDIDGISSGDYTVTITDSNKCTHIQTITIEQENPVIATSESSNETCPDRNDGSIEVEISGGEGPYMITWSTGSFKNKIDRLEAGEYVITATDANYCETTDTIIIREPETLEVFASSPEKTHEHNVSYNDSTDGEIYLEVQGGTKPYYYAWNTGDTTSQLEEVGAGYYSVVVTDSNGCEDIDFIFLSEPDALDMPSGISPNNDGLNDYFVIKGLEAYPGARITVVNRWGSTVYEKENYNNQWNGVNNNGERLPDGTYFVLLNTQIKGILLQGFVDVRR